jgi:uncharacterized RDD family membrane protein YckC
MGSATAETLAPAQSEFTIGNDPPAGMPIANAGREPEPTSETSLPGILPSFAENAGNEKTEETTAWRDELAARLSLYRSRRKPRPPRYPSLGLAFNRPPAIEGSFASVIESALALDPYNSSDSSMTEVAATSVPVQATSEELSAAAAHQGKAHHQTKPPDHLPAKILQFPRLTSAIAPIPLNELAEPVSSFPRILDVPDVLPPPPALGGITIEPSPLQTVERLPGIDVPLQSAPLSRRLLAGIIDAIIVASGCALAACIFWKVAALRPPRFQLLALAPVTVGLLWAAYQHLLIVYAGKTPGLTIARLELTGFSGNPVCTRLRRWRVLASYLSALSLGMGYAWVFVDEDSLCWHDRITHTYLAPKKLAL